MGPASTVLLVAFSLIALWAVCVWGARMYWRNTLYSEREVASDLDLSEDWVELTPRPYLRARRRVQHIAIVVDGYHRSPHDGRRQVLLPDGTTANPEVEIVDKDGERFQLRPGSYTSCGLWYRRAGATHSGPPDGTIYTKVRIRSDKPFRASKVMWGDANPK